MSKELAPSVCGTGSIAMTRYWGGAEGKCLQLTFRSAETGAYEYMQLNASQAQSLAFALIEFVTDTRPELEQTLNGVITKTDYDW